MSENPKVSAWLDDLEHPLKDVILAVRTVFLEADKRITETIKWQSPTFSYKGKLARYANMDAMEADRTELVAIVRVWCDAKA